MKAFKKWYKKNSSDFKKYPHSIVTNCIKEHEKDGWKAALKHFNKLFNEGMHPQDVIFAMQKELEDE